MNYWLIYGILGVMLFLLGLFIFYMFNKKWIDFSVKLRYYRGKYKQHLGFLWVRDSGNNFDLPKIIDLRKIKDTEDEDTFITGRDQLLGTTLFGRPFVMYDNDDSKTSLGLYKQEQDKDGEPMFHQVNNNFLKDSAGNRMPVLSQRKPSITLPPNLFQSVVTQEVFRNLKKYINSFMAKHKYILLVVGLIFVGILAMLYMQYDQKQVVLLAIEACKGVVA